MVVKLDAQRTGEHHVEFLPVVGRQRDRRRLSGLVVTRGDDERLGCAMLELGSEVPVMETGAALDRHPLAGTREGVE